MMLDPKCVGTPIAIPLDQTVITWPRAECERITMRQVAQNLGVDASYLSPVLAGLRHMPKSLVRAMYDQNPQPFGKITL
jgi:hypothetical protein